MIHQTQTQPSLYDVTKETDELKGFLSMEDPPPLGCCIGKDVSVDVEEFKAAFKRMDTDGSGQLESSELGGLLTSIYGFTSPAMEQKLLKQLDANGDGVVQWDEFQVVVDMHQSRRQLKPFERIYLTFEDPSSSITAKIISIFVIAVIGISSTAFILETLPTYREHPSDDRDKPTEPLPVFKEIELWCIVVFTIEYLARFLTVHAVRYHKVDDPTPLKDILGNEIVEKPSGICSRGLSAIGASPGVIRTWDFVCKTANVIDLVAIVPWYIELLAGSSGAQLAVFRVFRLVRVFRVFKLGKYNEGMKLFARVIMNSMSALYLLCFFFMISIILFGSMIYFAEQGKWYGPGEYCPDVNSVRPPYDCHNLGPRDTPCNKTCSEWYKDGIYLRANLFPDDSTAAGYEPTPFTSIPFSFWWVVTTTTTVGYGDLYPTTVWGKLIGTVCMLTGILVLALPITIIGTNFTNEYQEMQRRGIEAAKEEEERKKFKARFLAGESMTSILNDARRKGIKKNTSVSLPPTTPAQEDDPSIVRNPVLQSTTKSQGGRSNMPALPREVSARVVPIDRDMPSPTTASSRLLIKGPASSSLGRGADDDIRLVTGNSGTSVGGHSMSVGTSTPGKGDLSSASKLIEILEAMTSRNSSSGRSFVRWSARLNMLKEEVQELVRLASSLQGVATSGMNIGAGSIVDEPGSRCLTPSHIDCFLLTALGYLSTSPASSSECQVLRMQVLQTATDCLTLIDRAANTDSLA